MPPDPAGNRRPGRPARLGLHLLALAALLAAAVAQATFRQDLWPFDLRFSALIAAGGIAVLAIAWWPVAAGLALAAALLPGVAARLMLWPAAVALMLGLHALLGPRMGFLPLADLGVPGALWLYALPAALPILAGSALRTALPRGRAAAPPQSSRSAEGTSR
jgi:hypothetical protein